MHYTGRSTVCVSSQAGCAMACSFCATGQSGFRRHLTPGEILEQVAVAVRAARPRRLSNIVFMGMGEPLANFDNLWSAIERIHGEFGIGARGLTVSTVGIVPGIRRLTAAPLPVGLAVSLHAATEKLRNELVPINRRYPIAALMEACADYRAATGRRVSFEWAMIDGVNDDDAQAEQLARLAGSVRAHVNLIPLNPTPGYPVRGTPPRRIAEFRARLVELGTTVTIRSTRGSTSTPPAVSSPRPERRRPRSSCGDPERARVVDAVPWDGPLGHRDQTAATGLLITVMLTVLWIAGLPGMRTEHGQQPCGIRAVPRETSHNRDASHLA